QVRNQMTHFIHCKRTLFTCHYLPPRFIRPLLKLVEFDFKSDSSKCEIVPNIGRPSFSKSSSVLLNVSRYSNKQATRAPSIAPSTSAIAILSIGLGATGDESSSNSAFVKILTLSIFISS